MNYLKMVAINIALLLSCSTASAFEVVSQHGKKRSFREMTNSGTWLVVMLWAHDCIPCEKQKPILNRFSSKNYNKGVVVVGLSTDNKSERPKAKAAMERSSAKFHNYLYQGNDFASDYRTLTGTSFIGTPTYLIYTPTGTLSGLHVGPIKLPALDNHFANKTKETSPALSPGIFR